MGQNKPTNGRRWLQKKRTAMPSENQQSQAKIPQDERREEAIRELFELIDSVLGCKPTSEPLVVVDSILSSADVEAGTSLECISRNSSEVFSETDVFGAGFTVEPFDVESHLDGSSLISSEQDRSDGNEATATSSCDLTHAISSKGKQAAGTAKEEKVSHATSTSQKRKKLATHKSDKMADALNSLGEFQKHQTALFLEMEEKRHQTELELEEKRLKLEQESEQRRVTFMMDMMKMLAKGKDT